VHFGDVTRIIIIPVDRRKGRVSGRERMDRTNKLISVESENENTAKQSLLEEEEKKKSELSGWIRGGEERTHIGIRD
jgi:hypothetical protein